jgi:hypothetical protein
LDFDLEKDLRTNCMKYIGNGMARVIYNTIDSQFSKLTPQFNVIVGKTTYLYNISKIVSTTEITYNQVQETGSAVTTMTGDVELTSGQIKLSEIVRFVVLIMLFTISLSRLSNIWMEKVHLIMVRLL